MSHSGLELLNDTASYEERFLTGLDPRLKLSFTLIFLLVIISSRNLLIPVAILLLMTIGLLALKINHKLLLLRGLPALFIAVTLLLTQIFLYGKTRLVLIQFWGWQLFGYQEGLDHGLLLMFRVLAGISLMFFLTLSTPMNKLIFAAKWLRFPKAFLEVLTITYRYIFILFAEITTVKNAQKLRLGFSSFKKSITTLGNLSGIIILRAIDKSEKLYQSMKSRGYNGQQINVYYQSKFRQSDWLILICLILVLGFILVFC